ncbi:hypothetical protein HZC30_04055 [Candidatus Woesearchaeota archaeon]|nr:hypothetical protein [Candidatus Woesearchaeota archaeon]
MEDQFKKYAGECVAMIDDKVVASGKTYSEAYKTAKLINANKLISLMYVPTKKETLTFL